jgi:hypothetical protein
MGDFSDDYGGYDILGLYEQRDEDRRAQRAKLLTLPEPAQKPMHPELRKMWEDYFDKCFREFSAAQRPWVSLTDEERMDILLNLNWDKKLSHMDTALAIEAKLKEKNT